MRKCLYIRFVDESIMLFTNKKALYLFLVGNVFGRYLTKTFSYSGMAKKLLVNSIITVQLDSGYYLEIGFSKIFNVSDVSEGIDIINLNDKKFYG